MKNNNDVEKDLKERIKELKSGEMAASASEVKLLLDRVADYRKKLHGHNHKQDARMSAIQRELADQRQLISWARKRLDPEGKGTGLSVLDTYEAAELVQELERRRGVIIAGRMLYGGPLEETYKEETIGVLTAAIDEARKSEERWRNYLKEALHKDRQVKVNT